MPVTCKKIGGTFRVVESGSDQVATNQSGAPVDGGGHQTSEECQQQAKAINANREANSPSNNPPGGNRLRNP